MRLSTMYVSHQQCLPTFLPKKKLKSKTIFKAVAPADEVPLLFAPNKLDVVDTTPSKTLQSIDASNNSLQLTTLAKSLPNANLTSTPLKRPSGHPNKHDYDGKKTKHTQEQEQASYEGPSTFHEEPLILSANVVHMEQGKSDRKSPCAEMLMFVSNLLILKINPQKYPIGHSPLP